MQKSTENSVTDAHVPTTKISQMLTFCHFAMDLSILSTDNIPPPSLPLSCPSLTGLGPLELMCITPNLRF